MLFKNQQIIIVFGYGGGAIILCAQGILRRWRQMVALSELLALISIAFGFLLKQLRK